MSNDPAAIVSNPRPLRVFLCHSSADKPAVRELYQRLKVDGFEPWLDEENLLPGQAWQREIPKAVQNSDAVIVCLSRGSVNKAGYIQKEIRVTLDIADEKPEGAVFVIPVRLEECVVPDKIRERFHWCDLFEPRGYGRLMLALRLREEQLIDKEELSANLPPNAEPIVSTPYSLKPRHPAIRTAMVIVSRSGDGAIDARRVGEVHELMSSRPGPDRFCFLIMARGNAVQLDFPHDTTTLNDDLIRQLKSMPGVESLQVSLI